MYISSIQKLYPANVSIYTHPENKLLNSHLSITPHNPLIPPKSRFR
jgi:hypothetical protein